MSNTASYQELGKRIERLVQEQIAAIHQTAREALERAFIQAPKPPAARKAPKRSRAPGASSKPQRSPEEVSALSGRLYEALRDNPGEPIGVLASSVGASARELHRPMALLKRTKRVRSVGQRQATRYFPMAPAAAETANAHSGG